MSTNGVVSWTLWLESVLIHQARRFRLLLVLMAIGALLVLGYLFDVYPAIARQYKAYECRRFRYPTGTVLYYETLSPPPATRPTAPQDLPSAPIRVEHYAACRPWDDWMRASVVAPVDSLFVGSRRDKLGQKYFVTVECHHVVRADSPFREGRAFLFHVFPEQATTYRADDVRYLSSAVISVPDGSLVSLDKIILDPADDSHFRLNFSTVTGAGFIDGWIAEGGELRCVVRAPPISSP